MRISISLILICSLLLSGTNISYATQFPGTAASVIDMGNNQSLYTSKGTVSFWVKTNTDSGQAVVDLSDKTIINDFQFTVGNGVTAGCTNEIITLDDEINGSNQHRMCYTTNTRSEVIDNQWHFIAWTSDGATYKLYLDGNQKTITIGVGSNNGLWISNMPIYNSFKFGSTTGTGSVQSFPMNGQIANVSIFNRALTQYEVIGLYRYNYVPSGLIGRYLLYGKSGDFIPDTSIVHFGGNASGGTSVSRQPPTGRYRR